MEIVTSWMKTGMQQEAQKLVLRQLHSLVGNVSLPLEEQINSLSTEKLEDLSVALLRFSDESDLTNWLAQHG
jgi:Domain of unknown function (DUF4351)